jgi:hypothetical protein
MIIKEYIEFERGQNPKKSLRIGVHHLIPQIIEKFEESPFELTRRGEVLDLEQKYEVSPENFHNPAGHPKYDWEFVYIMEDFEVSILYMIDLNNGEILRKMKVSNPRIDAEYIDNENWKITSLNPDKIYEEIDQDYALIDIADAAEYLWDMYQKQIEEEEFEDEEIDESLDFERGKTPEQIKRDLRGHFRPGEILLRPDNGYSPHQTIMVFKRITPPDYAGEQYYEVATLGYINTKGEVKTYGSSRFAMDDSNKGNMVSIDTKTRFPNKEEELLIKRFLNKSKIWKIKEAIGIYPILNGKSLSLTESIDFVRGQENPLDSLEIGRVLERIKEQVMEIGPDIAQKTSLGWLVTQVKFVEGIPEGQVIWNSKSLKDLTESGWKKLFREMKEIKSKMFPNMKEGLEFNRGMDPRDSMEIGRIEERREALIDWIIEQDPMKWTGSSVLAPFITRRHPHPWGWDMKKFEDASLMELNHIKEYIEKWEVVDKKYNVFDGPASKVHERLDFERGMDPKQSMDIGRFAKIHKITSSDLEFLKIYTNDGDGKGHVNEKFFEEVYQDSSGFPKYLERVREVYQILEPYEYLFGDHFPSDMKKEMREYVKSYLKNPKYNYAYNCDIMGDGDVDVFFSEIKLPSAELLGKKPGLKESVNFERGIDPKKSMGIGLKAKVLKGLSRLVQELHIGSINLSGNGTDLWLEVSDYGIANFEDYFFSLLNKEFFKQYYIEAKPRKYKNSWKNDWVFIIKPEYKSSFRACFDRNGYLLAIDELEESVNFERGLDKEKLRIGNIRPVEKLKKDYDNIQELVQTSKYSDFQLPFGEEVLKSIPDTNHFGWGNIQNNFKNMSREELFPFELIVRKYTKLMGLE